MNQTSPARAGGVAAAALGLAAVLAIAGFLALGSIFEYPQILKQPTDSILALYRLHETAVRSWFLVLMISAAMVAPAGVTLGRLAGGRLGVWTSITGVAAALVQIIGLSRWVLLVPSLSDAALNPATRAGAEDIFRTLHFWLGTIVGETAGYALTALFTVLVGIGLARAAAPRSLLVLGYASAALIATGVLVPLGLDAARLTNFAGYIGWCLWLVLVAVVLVTSTRRRAESTSDTSALLRSREGLELAIGQMDQLLPTHRWTR